MNPLLPDKSFDELILIVDDNVDFAENMQGILGERGLKCEVAVSASQARKLAGERSFSIALLDINLPDGNGVSLLTELRQQQSELLAIMVTGYQSMDNSIGALNAGAFGYVSKGGGPEDLIAAVERAVEQRRLARDNERLRALYREVLAAIPGQLIVIDEKGGIISVNRRGADLMLGKDAFRSGDLVATALEPLARSNPDLQKLLAAERGVVSATVVVEGEGSRRVFDVRSFPLGHQDAKRAILFTDITSILELEHRLREAEHLATVGRLAAVVAHEIKNPLAGIRGTVQVLQSRMQKLTGKTDEAASELLGLVDRMTATIQDLLAYARPTPPKMSEVALLKELRSCLGLLSADDAMRGIDSQLDIGDDLRVRGDPYQLRQVFTNLFLNAAQAMNGNGRIRVEAKRDQAQAIISISDTGPGIDSTALPHIFDPFFTTKTHGTGLGLAITQRIVREHGGSINVEKPNEGGACFRVVLPLDEAQDGPASR